MSRRSRNPMVRLAALLGCTEGQAYTLAIAVVLTVATVWVGVPPTLVDRVQHSAGAGPQPYLPREIAADVPEVRSPLAPVPLSSTVPRRSAATPAAQPPRRAASPVATPLPVPASRFGPARVAANVGQPGAPDGVGTLSDGRIVVATNNGGTRGAKAPSEVIRFSPDGARERSVAIEDQPATRTTGLAGLVVDGARNVYVADTAGARIVRVDPGGKQDTYVEFPDLGACALLVSADACEEGARDDRPAPRGLALDGAGNLFVADEGQAVVWLVDVRGRPSLWRAFPDTDPPVAAAVERSGSVLVLVARSVDPSRAGNGVLHRFATRGAEGSVVAVTEPLSEPSGVAVGPGGEVVLALSGGNALALLSADGRERDRLEAADVEGRTGVPLDGPSGVVVSAGSAWVTNGSPRSNTEANWVVFEVPLGA